jgi:predicted  nucleic acid-binding Zn-ribbon protein
MSTERTEEPDAELSPPARAVEAPGDQAPPPFDALLRVQDLDTAISQLQHRRATLPERAELGGVEQRLAGITTQMTEAGARRQTLVDRQAELERQIATLNARRAGLEEKLYASRGTAARDLQAMNEEIGHLSSRRAEIEEIELTLMEEQEPIESELAALRAEQVPLLATAEALRASLRETEAVVLEELREFEASRGKEAAQLPGDLADRYEVLRARLKGTGAARLVGNRCGGCHLELSAVEVDRIRHLPNDVIVTCDQCGRILVRTGPTRGA